MELVDTSCMLGQSKINSFNTLIIMLLLLNEPSKHTWLFIKHEAIKGKDEWKSSG